MNSMPSVDRVIDTALRDHKIVGTVVQVAQHGKTLYRRAAGMADREAGRPVTVDTIFRLASVTKTIVAATTLALVEAGKLRLDDPVAKHLPFFTPKFAGHAPTITILHLLTHTAGLSYSYPAPAISAGLDNSDLDFQTNFSRIASMDLDYEPGTAWEYSVAIDVLGAVVASVFGGTLEQAIQHYVTSPLGLADTAFRATDPSRLAAAYLDGTPEPERMRDVHPYTDADGGVTIFAPARLFNPKAFQSGGAGMASTITDMMIFFDALRDGGGPILQPQSVENAMSNHIGDLKRDDAGQRFGLFGAVLADPVAAASPQSMGTVSWGGIYGNTWFIDPARGLTVVALTNTAPEGCLGQFPNLVRDAVYAAIAQ